VNVIDITRSFYIPLLIGPFYSKMVMDLDPPMRLVPQPCVSPVRNVAVDVTTKSKNKTTWPAENKKIESSDCVEKAHGSPRKEDPIMEGIR
jgi:hypothetical protein